jgi:hypothetical protein
MLKLLGRILWYPRFKPGISHLCVWVSFSCVFTILSTNLKKEKAYMEIVSESDVARSTPKLERREIAVQALLFC